MCSRLRFQRLTVHSIHNQPRSPTRARVNGTETTISAGLSSRQPTSPRKWKPRPGLHRFHSDFGESYIWGFNGRYPAPTVLGKYGKSTIVRFRNTLPVGGNTFGKPEITIHLHNGHHGSESDGFAGDWFPTNFWKDNLYPNCYAGLDTFGGNGDPREKMGTFWFHDHRAEFTANNNVLGLNGMYIVYDETDPGHEHPSAGVVAAAWILRCH